MFTPGTKVKSIHRIHYTGKVWEGACHTCGHNPSFMGSVLVEIGTPGVVTQLNMEQDRQTEVWVLFEGHSDAIRMTLNSMIGIQKEKGS